MSKTLPKMAVIGPQDVAKYLAKTKRKKSPKLPASPSREEAAHYLMDQFSSERVLDSLVDSEGYEINVEWLIEKWVEEYNLSTEPKDRREALDKLERFIVLGAIQDKELAASVGQIVSGKKEEPISDPVDRFVPRVVGVKQTKRA